MRVWSTIGLPLVALGALGFSASLVPACSSNNPSGPGNTQDSGPSGAYTGPAGQQCQPTSGGTPNPECDDGDETTCSATATKCTIAPMCGDTSTCLPMADNSTATVKSFRMRRIILVSPAALNAVSDPTIENTVVTSGVNLNEPQCGETGTGDFSWLLSYDLTNNTVKTGGAPPCDISDTPTGNGNAPACNPFTTGYCFVNKQVSTPGGKVINVQPQSAAITKGSDGTYSTASMAIPIVNIPIYFQGSIIILPISGGSITGVKISTDGNCIGKFNPIALNADCTDNYQNCSKWMTDGSLTGYITLEDADTVEVALLHQSLCAILTKNPDPMTGNCVRDASGHITAKGDYCATTKKPQDCGDSFWLSATFAAAAVKIDPTGANQPDCSGGGTPDAGTDAGGSDAGADTGAPEDAGADTGSDTGAPGDSGTD